MIVPMKKITIIVQSKDAEITLKSVRKLGILHVKQENLHFSDDISILREKSDLAAQAIAILPEKKDGKIYQGSLEDFTNEILKIADDKELLVEEIDKINKDIEEWKDWGEFSPDVIEGLKDRNIWVRLCKIEKRLLKDVPEGVLLERLFQKGNSGYYAVISRKEVSLPFEVIEPPDIRLSSMQEKVRMDEDKLNSINKRLLDLAEYKNSLDLHKKNLDKLIEFNTVQEGIGRFERLSYLTGYCPVYKAECIEKKAAEEKWGIIIENPKDEDIPPTLIKNPKWVEIIKPVFKIINTIPGYKEVDISLHFLAFFALFFGMLIGDAGYGLVYLIAGMFMHWKLRASKDKKFVFLTYLLSSCAILWGLITGVFFGPHSWLKPLIPYFANDINTQSFCFLIGAVQLSIAHLWKFLRKWPSLKAFSDMGWIFILWTAYFMANNLILSKGFPFFGQWIFIAGAFLVILFTSPDRNILKCVGLGLGDFLLKLMNSFGDVISYIRLFAVGAAGVAIADAFNQMAISVGNIGIINIVSSSMILFLGHTLNIVMGILAILVHGVRLNVLEFSGHLDIEWSGVEYAPFSE